MAMAYYKCELDGLSPYELLIECWSSIFGNGAQTQVLDHMNFSRDIFPDPLPVSKIIEVMSPEPGYLSPDCSIELRRAVLDLERERTMLLSNKSPAALETYFESVDVGFGNGCSNVMSAVLHSILNLQEQRLPHAAGEFEILVVVPSYTIYCAQVAHHGKRSKLRLLPARREHGYLPKASEVEEAVTPTTAALMLTYPSNPAQTTYGTHRWKELSKIIRLCQERKVFLIVDNIYQDLVYDLTVHFPEIHSLSSNPSWLVKLYGCSKEVPYFSGYRTGYWIGDRRIGPLYRRFISSTENSLNSISMLLFLFVILLKTARLRRRALSAEDCEHFNHGILGWGRRCDPAEALERLTEQGIEEGFWKAMDYAFKVQEEAIEEVRAFHQGSWCFSDFTNENIGNLGFLRLKEGCFFGTDLDLFSDLLHEVSVGVLPGRAFGMPSSTTEQWFRITLIHDRIESILDGLKKIDLKLSGRG